MARATYQSTTVPQYHSITAQYHSITAHRITAENYPSRANCATFACASRHLEEWDGWIDKIAQKSWDFRGYYEYYNSSLQAALCPFYTEEALKPVYIKHCICAQHPI